MFMEDLRTHVSDVMMGMWEPIWMAFLFMQITEYHFNVLAEETNCGLIDPVSSL